MKSNRYLHRISTCLLTLCLLLAGAVSSLPVRAEKVSLELSIYREVDEPTLNRYRKLLTSVYDPQQKAAIDSFMTDALHQQNWCVKYLAYRLKILHYNMENRTDEAVATARAGAKLADEHHAEEAYYEMITKIVSSYAFESRYYAALQEAQGMADKAAKEQSIYGAIMANYCLGMIFSYRTELHQAIRYFEQSLENMEQYEMTPYLYSTYLFLAQCHRNLFHVKKAKMYLEKAAQTADNDLKRYNVEFCSLLLLYDHIPEAEFLRRYESVRQNPMFDKVIDPDTKIILQAMASLSMGMPAKGLAMSYQIENRTQQLEMRISALKRMRNYDEAFRCIDSLQLYNDSVRSALQLDALAEAQEQVKNVEIEQRAQRSAQRMRSIIIGLVIILLLLTTLFLTIQNRRKRHFLRIMKRNNEELTRARQKAEEALKMKTAFIQNMSHEIRTPLNQISGFAQLLLSEQIGEEERAMGQRIITEQSESLSKMLNVILEISNVESETGAVEMSDIECRPFLQEVCEEAGLPQPGVEWRIARQTADGLHLHSSPSYLSKVLRCLIDNAFKFTTEGYIAIDATLRIEGGIDIRVSNTGKPIPPELSEKIFDRFYKVDSFVPGVGLGLSLARLYAHRIGATVWLDTSSPTPTCFVISQPAPDAAAPQPE